MRPINDFCGHVTCQDCDWHGDADEMFYQTGDPGIYVCPECFSDRIYDF